MKTYKQLLNEWAQQTDCLHTMTDAELKQLQNTLLEMYKDIANVCESNGLTVMLGGGSCLGAIRHKGFIPWDDDLDLLMARPDYDKLLQILREDAMGEKYEYAYPDGKNPSSSAFLKIYKKNTRLTSWGDEKAGYPQGIFIDIFPLDGTPSTMIGCKIKGFIANTIRLIGNCVAGVEHKSPEFERAINDMPELKSMVKKRIFLGKMFSFASYIKWAYWFEKFVANGKKAKLLTAPTGRKLYNGEIHPYEVFLPVNKMEFEGIECNVPGQTEAYLTKLYGPDYMQLPPEEKRERHFISELKF